MTIMEYKCTKCDFKFKDESLIFYIKNNKIVETTLTLESSKMMTSSELSGYLYIGYCKNCETYIKTYIPEIKGKVNEEDIINKINSLIDKTKNDTKVLVFDFDETSFQYRRKIICDNTCPKCGENVCLLVDEFHPCPKCGYNSIITIE